MNAVDRLQDTLTWTDINGRAHLLLEMPTGYLENVLAYVVAHASPYRLQSDLLDYVYDENLLRYDRGVLPWDSGSPEEWIQDQPVYRRIVEILQNRKRICEAQDAAEDKYSARLVKANKKLDRANELLDKEMAYWNQT